MKRPGKVSISDAGPACPVPVQARVSHETAPPVLDQPSEQTALPELADAYRRLLAMYKVSSIIRSSLDLDKLLDEVLAQVFRNFRAERGLIMLVDDESGELVPAVFRSRSEDPSAAEMTISRTIVSQVVEKQEAILTSDATLDDRFKAGQSIIQQDIRSVMCAPLSTKNRVLGIIYVDCRSQAGTFKKADLELLTAIGNEAGIAVENRLLRDANIKAERLAAVGQTVADLSHYIKNVLSCMQAGSDIVNRALERNDMEGVRKGWSIVDRNERKISELVLDMLSYSTPRRPARVSCNLNNIVEDVVESIRPAAASAGVRIVLELDPELPEAQVDPSGMQRCIMNLIDNALDAVAGRPDPTVTISTSREGSSVIIRVRDNGPGVPEEIQSRIFDVFFSTKGDAGTGLGLAVVKKIVNEHAGELSLFSPPGRGAEFRVVLPIKPAESAPE